MTRKEHSVIVDIAGNTDIDILVGDWTFPLVKKMLLHVKDNDEFNILVQTNAETLYDDLKKLIPIEQYPEKWI